MEMIRPSEDVDFSRDLCMLPFARIVDAFLLQESDQHFGKIYVYDGRSCSDQINEKEL
jgi:hypothetical protein